MHRLAITACLTLTALWAVARTGSEANTEPAFVYTATKHYVAEAWSQGGERFPLGAEVIVRDSETAADARERPLVPGFAASADPSVSFDGKRILFSGRRTAQDRWEVWQLSRADNSVQKLVACDQDCIRPLYLPEGRVVYARKTRGRFVIETAILGKPERLQLTYSAGNSMPLDVLRDGRILFQANYPLGGDATTELYTVYSDGSGVEAYRCDHGPRRRAGKQITSGDIVLVSASGLARFTSPLAHELKVSSPAGEYAGDIAEVPDGAWLVSWRAGSKLPYELVRWPVGSSKLTVIQSRSDADLVQPVLLAPRPVPNRHPSGLHDWTYANLLCLNTYTSKYKIAAGSVATVRLYTEDDRRQVALLGEAPVEKDGSFYVRMPADRPLQVQLLDLSGKIVQKEEGWFWLRRGEQRICVGCHAGPETSPENAIPLVLLRSTIPADMTAKPAQVTNGGH
jgi:Hydrazine synthase alpha subunit middle domain